jgi:hypothetical protein
MLKERKSYSEKLRDPRWQQKRLEILNRDNWTCRFCGDGKTELHIHHVKYSGEPWEGEDKDKITACKHCHRILEDLKEEIKTCGYSVKKVIKRPFQNRPGYHSAVALITIDNDIKSTIFFDLSDDCVNWVFACPLDRLISILNDFEKL